MTIYTAVYISNEGDIEGIGSFREKDQATGAIEDYIEDHSLEGIQEEDGAWTDDSDNTLIIIESEMDDGVIEV